MDDDELDEVESNFKHEIDLGVLRTAPTLAELEAVAAKTHVAWLKLPAGKSAQLTTPEELYRLLKTIRPPELDVDTEFSGWTDGAWDRDFVIKETSCYLRVKAYLISLAFVGCEAGIVFEPTPAHLRILIAYITKVKPIIFAHKAGVDVHALHGGGVDLTGARVVDTVQAARWFFPSYMKDEDDQKGVGHGLDAMYRVAFPEDNAKLMDYDEVFTGKAHCFWLQTDVREKELKVCSCKATGCRKKGPDHVKGLEYIYVEVQLKKSKTFEFTVTPEELRANHAAWMAWVDYSRKDAAMLHRWRIKMLNGKVAMPALAAPPECVKMT